MVWSANNSEAQHLIYINVEKSIAIDGNLIEKKRKQRTLSASSEYVTSRSENLPEEVDVNAQQ